MRYPVLDRTEIRCLFTLLAMTVTFAATVFGLYVLLEVRGCKSFVAWKCPSNQKVVRTLT